MLDQTHIIGSLNRDILYIKKTICIFKKKDVHLTFNPELLNHHK